MEFPKYVCVDCDHSILLNKCTDLSEVLDVVLLSYKFNVDEHMQTHHAVPKPIIL